MDEDFDTLISIAEGEDTGLPQLSERYHLILPFPLERHITVYKEGHAPEDDDWSAPAATVHVQKQVMCRA